MVLQRQRETQFVYSLMDTLQEQNRENEENTIFESHTQRHFKCFEKVNDVSQKHSQNC